MDKETWEEIIKNRVYTQELDWLAMDNKGQLGIFTALMGAPIPDVVKVSLENYLGLSRRIGVIPESTEGILITQEIGDFSDWISYAAKGFYAFDFQDAHRTVRRNVYDAIAKPARPLKIDNLDLPLRLLNSVVKVDVDFSNGDIRLDRI